MADRTVPSETLARLASEIASWTLELAYVVGTLEGMAPAPRHVDPGDMRALAERLSDLRIRIHVIREWARDTAHPLAAAVNPPAPPARTAPLRLVE